MYEIKPLISHLHFKSRDSWEQARLISYVIAQVNSRKKLNPTDIITFDWDKKDKVENETTISNADIERLASNGNDHRRRNPRKWCCQPNGQDHPYQRWYYRTD